MLRNFFLLAWRNALRQGPHTLINLVGLSIGLATCLIIALYVQDESRFDQFHSQADELYRVQRQFSNGEESSHWAASQPQVKSWMVDRFPEVVSGARLLPSRVAPIMRYEDKQFQEPGFVYVDSTFFQLFDFEWLQGDKARALVAPNQLVLTASSAKKYFGNENPIGKTLQTDNSTFAVTGIVADPPFHSHIQFDMLAPMAHLATLWPGVDQPGPSVMYTYLLIPDEGKARLEEKLVRDVWGLFGVDLSQDSLPIPPQLSASLFLNPVSEIHLNGNAEKELGTNSSWEYLYFFITLAIFVLLVACINYMNLATARSMRRAREVGVRKVLGAAKSQLIGQFLGESLLFVFVSMLLSLGLVALFIPAVNELTGKTLGLNFIENPALLGGLLLVSILVGLLSGAYPALFLAGFDPIRSLKAGSSQSGGQKGGAVNLRKMLVVVQFAISVFLIVGATSVYRQLRFIQTSDLGFQKEQVIVTELPGATLQERGDLLKQRLEQEPSVMASSKSAGIPGVRVPIMGVRVPDLATESDETGQAYDGQLGMRILSIDEDFAETVGLEIVAGRDLDTDIGSDSRTGFLLNEAAIEEFGFEENPVGRPFEYTYGLDTPKVGTVIGVVKDFHYASLHSEVEPLMLHVYPPHYSYLSVRIGGENLPETLSRLEAAWREVIPEVPFSYFFLDENYDQQYKAEQTLGTLFAYFTGLALFIACLGLLGLTSFIAQQRTREIGIRKVLGASVSQLIWLLSRQFALLVLIACVPGLLLAYYVMQGWLSDFAYSISLGPGMFLLSALLVALIAGLTVSWQALRASQLNPVEALKEE